VSGCTLCAGADGPDFDYCRNCGRGHDEPVTVEPMTGFRLAVRAAKGGPLSTDGDMEREAFRLGMQTDEGRAIRHRLAPAFHHDPSERMGQMPDTPADWRPSFGPFATSYGHMTHRPGKEGVWVQRFDVWTDDQGRDCGAWRWVRAEDVPAAVFHRSEP
jgi:hypothetical protein